MKSETQAECHKRLKCRPNEELEDCKKRLRSAQQNEGEGKGADRGEGDKNRGEGDKNRGEGDKNRDQNRGRDNADRNRDRRDRDADARERQREREREREKEREREREKERERQKERDRERRDRGRHGDDGGRHRGGGGGGEEAGGGGGGGGDGGGGGGGGGHGHGVMRPGTHPGFFSGGIGPSWGVCYRGDCHPGRVDYTAFYASLDFGWHFSGNFKGPAIGANVHGGFGSFGPYDDGRFGAGFKFWWDIQLARDLGLYFTPFAQAGWSSFIFGDRRFGCDPRFYNCNNNWEHFFNVQFGAMIRMILGDRGLLYVQPMTFDNVFNGGGYGLLYHFEIGGGFIFGG